MWGQSPWAYETVWIIQQWRIQESDDVYAHFRDDE